MMEDYIDRLEAALIDIIKGEFVTPMDLVDGLSPDRVEEIMELCEEANRNYCVRHGIKP